jgi:hypothetical protein
MLKTFKHLALAASLFAAASTMAVTQAEAHGRGRGAGAVAGAIIGLGLLGAYAAGREHASYCHPGPRVCDVVGQRCWTNRYGEYRCKDDVRCYRREICD